MLALVGFGKIKAEGDRYAKSWKRARLVVAKKRLPGWQEAFMASRIKEYTKLLSDETKLASERFWQLDKMIKEDRKKNRCNRRNVALRHGFDSIKFIT